MKVSEAVALAVIEAVMGANDVRNPSRKSAVLAPVKVAELELEVPVKASKDGLEIVSGPETVGVWRLKVKIEVGKVE